MIFCSNLLVGQNGDYRLLRKIHVERNQNLDGFMLGVSTTEPWITMATPIFYGGAQWLMNNSEGKQKALMMVGAAAMSAGITTILKESVRRDRPYETHADIHALDHTGPLSFPSGHTASAFNLATSVSLACPKWYIISSMYVWAGLTGYSRMHLGVHYPSDVLAGALIGSGTALLSNYIMQRIRDKRTVNDACRIE
ncbi:MAG: phosphatase PAP2 family protein [Flavobacteriales bacterium]